MMVQLELVCHYIIAWLDKEMEGSEGTWIVVMG